MTTETFLADIPESLACSAYSGTSFTPEKRGETARQEYANSMAHDYAGLIEIAKGDPVKLAIVEAEFPSYRQRFAQYYRKHLASRARCISWMITGPANFPLSRNEKRNRVADRRLNEMLEFRKRAMAAIRKAMFPELRPIMAGDSDACERLQEKIDAAEKLQLLFCEVNEAIRKHRKDGAEAQIAAVAAVFRAANVKRDPEAYARELLKPDFAGRIGFASFELTNNAANIRRMKQRMEGIARNQAAPAVEKESTNGIRLEDCPAENRVRLFFPGKPDVDVRTKLKRSGFRWAPTLGCWQAYRNSGTIATAQGML